MDRVKETKKTYGFLWTRNERILPPDKWHLNVMQEVIGQPIVRGQKGIDVGSGCGYDTYIMARDNPSVGIVSIDLSDGVYTTRGITSALRNVRIIKCSILDAPLKADIFDFAYSFGVLHHTPDPQKGLLEIARILKKNSPVFLYLYEDHSGSFLKHIAVKLVAILRTLTVRIPRKIIYALCWLFSPFVFIVFSVPAKILRRFKLTEEIAARVPFNFGRGPFSLRGDLFDRFSAPIERRFSREEIDTLFSECGFGRITITRLKNSPGWVVWGYKI